MVTCRSEQGRPGIGHLSSRGHGVGGGAKEEDIPDQGGASCLAQSGRPLGSVAMVSALGGPGGLHGAIRQMT